MIVIAASSMARAAALSLAYLGSAELGHRLSIGSPGFATFWPASGLFLATLLLSRRRDWPLLVLATLPANLASDVLLHGKSVPVGLAFWLGNAGEAVLGAVLFRRWVARRPSLSRLRDAVGLITVPASSSAVLAATIGTATVRAAYGLDAVAPVWLAWWIADVLGILMVAPVLLSFAQEDEGEPLRAGQTRRILEAGALLALLLVMADLVFHHAAALSWPLPFFGVPFLLWAALRLGRRGLSLAALAVTLIAVGYVARGHGSDALDAMSPLDRVLSLQAFLATMAVSFLLLGAVLAERDRAQRTLRGQAEELRRFAQAVEQATDGISMGMPGKSLYHNQALVTHLGYSAEELDAAGGPAALFVDQAVAAEAMESAMAGRPWSGEVDLRAKDGRIVPVHLRGSVFVGDDGEPQGLLAILTVIEERRRREQALEAARELAQAANRAKSDFLANVSHEIRTPLNAILGMLELLSGTRLDAAQKRYVEAACSSGHALAALIADVLDLSKIEADKLDLERIPFDVRRLAADVVSAMRSKAASKGLRLELRVEPGVPPVLLGDPNRLRQIFVNLVDNGVKFTNEGGVSIRVEASATPRDEVTLRCEVADTGIGIPRERRESIFGMFEQADPTITRRYGGTGLGLAISRRLVELMGGDITVESEVGRGSTFRFTARLGKAEGDSLPELPPPPPVRPSALRRLEILVFEDSPVNREVVRGVLERDGHAVTLREDATSAVEAVFEGHHDLVLMDLQMPGVSGFEATARIREAERAAGRRRIPIVALTARALPRDREQCFAAGMDGYVAKPFRLPDLRREMASALGALPQVPDEAPAPVAAEVVLDADELLRLAGGDMGFVAKLASMFDRERTATLEQLRGAVSSGDLAVAERTAHKLKSSIGSVGGRRAHATARRIEELARSGSAGAIEEPLAHLGAELDELVAAMTALVQAGK